MSGATSIEYMVHIWQETRQYIAHAMPLDVISAGLSPEEARKTLDEAVHLFLITAADMRTLEDVLQESGYEFSQGGWVCPSWVAIERHSTVVTV
jgi:hypothetical protein